MLTRQHQKEHARKSSTHPMNMFNTLQHHQLYQHQSEFILLIQLKQHCIATKHQVTHTYTQTQKTVSIRLRLCLNSPCFISLFPCWRSTRTDLTINHGKEDDTEEALIVVKGEPFVDRCFAGHELFIYGSNDLAI